MRGYDFSSINFYFNISKGAVVDCPFAIFVPKFTNSIIKNDLWDWEHGMSSRKYAELLKESQNETLEVVNEL